MQATKRFDETPFLECFQNTFLTLVFNFILSPGVWYIPTLRLKLFHLPLCNYYRNIYI